MAELELEPPVEPEVEPEAEPEGAALDEEDESLGWVVEPAPAEPLVLEEPEPEGCALELEGALLDEDDEEPPLALSFFWMSIEVDEELEPEPEGAALELDGELVVPEAELEDEPGAVLGDAVEPAGAVVLEELDAPGARELLLSPQPARTAAPNAIETATAIVESFMWPPWLGYRKEAARIGPRLLRLYPRRLVFHRRFRVARLRTGLVAALLEVAALVGVLRVDLALRRVRAFALLRRAGRPRMG